MNLFLKISDKDLLEIRNKIFLNSAIPALKKNGFEQSPFSTAWFGRDNLGGYTYEMCRLSERSHLEVLTIHITRGDRWIKIFLNIFELRPIPDSMNELTGLEGLKYPLYPNNLTQMRLRIDDFKGIPLFNFVKHKIKSFSSKNGLQRKIKELSSLLEKDLTNIDSFICKWYELYHLNVTDWEGNKLE